MKFSERDIYKQLQRMHINSKDIDVNKDFYGSSPPSVFIGSKLSYPNVNVGLMSLTDLDKEAWMHNSPNTWSEQELEIKQIVKLRQQLINSRFKSNTYAITKSSTSRQESRFLTTLQELGMSLAQADVEVQLAKKPKPLLEFSQHHLPIGPSAQLRNLRLASNTKISPKVDKVYFDTDLKAVDAISYLSSKGFNEHQLTQLLSVGIMGRKKNRKLVPTRFSITATDDQLGRLLITQIKNYKQIENYELYYGGHLGNFYIIILMPDIFSYELFEMLVKNSSTNNLGEIAHDYENHRGRKAYVSETAGGYYAARLPILQLLNKQKRQASVLCLRFTLPSYNVPLGVWVCRNSVRKSLTNQQAHRAFDTKLALLNYAKALAKRDFGIDINFIIKKTSKLLSEQRTQKRLTEWFE
jgi:hypothetical protein